MNIHLTLSRMLLLMTAILLISGCAPAPVNNYNRYMEKGQYDLVIINITHQLEEHPRAENLYVLYNDRGEAYRLQGQFDRAIADYNKALEINPDYFIAWNNLGLAYKGKGELDKAITYYTKALEINPKFGIAYNNRARAYTLLKQYDKAADDDRKAKELGFKDTGRYSGW